MWQTKWTSYNKSRTTFAFFDKERNRLDARSLQTDHWVTQVLTGHGNFRARLASLELVDDAVCICNDQNDTVQHFLLECPLLDVQRVALREIVPDRSERVSGNRDIMDRPSRGSRGRGG
ncbi:reverse [Lasius niger]|uniref:Reverse n=1 Tax=Lasius niger TaxID=67767 RepID=A0A0J7KYG9_LASNI|nr:reverse [Lasius niger]